MDNKTQSDLADWLARSALGDRNAFENLYGASSPHLMAVIRRIVRHTHTAEDVLQEAYVQIWNRAGDFRPDRALPMTWMTSIARYRALDRLRRQDREGPAIELDFDLEDFDMDGPLAALAGRQSGGLLRQCLDLISLEQRSSIVLAFYHGLSHDQIAQHLSHPLGTVKSWIRRGMDKLKGCLES